MLQLTDTTPSALVKDGGNNKREKFSVPVTLGAPAGISELSQNSISPSNSSGGLEIFSKRTSDMSTKPMSVISPKDFINDNISGISHIDIDDTVFEHYYTVDRAMDDMTSPDAEKIVSEFQQSTWSSKETPELLSNLLTVHRFVE